MAPQPVSAPLGVSPLQLQWWCWENSPERQALQGQNKPLRWVCLTLLRPPLLLLCWRGCDLGGQLLKVTVLWLPQDIWPHFFSSGLMEWASFQFSGTFAIAPVCAVLLWPLRERRSKAASALERPLSPPLPACRSPGLTCFPEAVLPHERAGRRRFITLSPPGAGGAARD